MSVTAAREKETAEREREGSCMFNINTHHTARSAEAFSEGGIKTGFNSEKIHSLNSKSDKLRKRAREGLNLTLTNMRMKIKKSQVKEWERMQRKQKRQTTNRKNLHK